LDLATLDDVFAATFLLSVIRIAEYQCPRGRYLYLDGAGGHSAWPAVRINAPGGVIYIWTRKRGVSRGFVGCKDSINAPGGVIYIWTGAGGTLQAAPRAGGSGINAPGGVIYIWTALSPIRPAPLGETAAC